MSEDDVKVENVLDEIEEAIEKVEDKIEDVVEDVETKVEEVIEDIQADKPEATPKKKSKKKLGIVLGVIVLVLVVAFAGFWKWHETPSFCGAICHTPMDQYLVTYNQEADTAGVDKWGNEVENTSTMLCVSHQKEGVEAECLDCHVPVLSEQIGEGFTWVSGNYTFPLDERSVDQLVEARNLESGDEFCMNEGCHAGDRELLIKRTEDMEFNPHRSQHGEIPCSDCHKAHRASVFYCTQCHTEATACLPEGWITQSESDKILKGAE